MSRLIITTDDYDFIIYDLDTESITHRKGQTKELICTHLENKGRHKFRPFGIAQDEEAIYIASNDRLGKFNKNTFEFEKLIKVPLWINTHQILKDGEKLYTCNTAIDTVGIYGIEHLQLSLNYMKLMDQKFEPAYADQLDSRHINTIQNYGECIFFIRHNGNIVASDIGFFDKRTLEPRILISVGKSCHGIAIENNVLYTLSTGTGELVQVNLKTLEVQKFKIVKPEDTFLRGLDIVDGNLIIGCSINFKSNTEDRNCYMIVVDTKSITHKKLILQDIKFINDLKILT